MKELFSPKGRSKELLNLLSNYGPISIEMLQRMTDPQMKKKKLRRALGSLRGKNMINRLSLDPHTVYYQISQAKPNRELVSEIINASPESIEKPLLRRQDWMHNQWCDYWTYVIRRMYPEAYVIREHDIGSHELAKEILLVKGNESDVLPDLLVMFPKNEFGQINIALEIERTRKSNSRILRKFKKYMSETRIDGLVYLCDSGRLSETLRTLYETNFIAKSNRISHYRQNFFLFADSMSGGGPPYNDFYNAEGKPTSFASWCNLLRTVRASQRRDQNFEMGGALPPEELRQAK